MYDLPEFKTDDPQAVLAFMKAHPFALLIGTQDGRPEATQVPVLFAERDGRLYLQAHIMRKTTHHLAFERNPEVLLVFTGAHTYVSAGWYSQRGTASTWNYQSVHVRGQLRFLGEEGLLEVLRRTADHFEGGPDRAASFNTLSEEYVGRLMKAIVAFEVEVTGIEHVFKLSQNRDEESYRNIIRELEQEGGEAAAVAAAMKANAKSIYPPEPDNRKTDPHA